MPQRTSINMRNSSKVKIIVIIALIILNSIFATLIIVYRNDVSTNATSSVVTSQNSNDADSTNRLKNDQTFHNARPP